MSVVRSTLKLPTPTTKNTRRQPSTPWMGQLVLAGLAVGGGGSVITEAGNHPGARVLPHIAEFALDEGESCATIEQALPVVSKARSSR